MGLNLRVACFLLPKRVFVEANMMAKNYKERIRSNLTIQESELLPISALPFENETLYANLKWFKSEKKQ